MISPLVGVLRQAVARLWTTSGNRLLVCQAPGMANHQEQPLLRARPGVGRVRSRFAVRFRPRPPLCLPAPDGIPTSLAFGNDSIIRQVGAIAQESGSGKWG